MSCAQTVETKVPPRCGRRRLSSRLPPASSHRRQALVWIDQQKSNVSEIRKARYITSMCKETFSCRFIFLCLHLLQRNRLGLSLLRSSIDNHLCKNDRCKSILFHTSPFRIRRQRVSAREDFIYVFKLHVINLLLKVVKFWYARDFFRLILEVIKSL